jgi:hypothetical protein
MFTPRNSLESLQPPNLWKDLLSVSDIKLRRSVLNFKLFKLGSLPEHRLFGMSIERSKIALIVWSMVETHSNPKVLTKPQSNMFQGFNITHSTVLITNINFIYVDIVSNMVWINTSFECVCQAFLKDPAKQVELRDLFRGLTLMLKLVFERDSLPL